MKFITSREIRSNPARLWEGAGSDESVITVNGKPRAIVIAAGEDLEETLSAVRRARAVTALEKIRIYAHKKGLDSLPDKEIADEIRQSRAGR
jgi:hypothetical protein